MFRVIELDRKELFTIIVLASTDSLMTSGIFLPMAGIIRLSQPPVICIADVAKTSLRVYAFAAFLSPKPLLEFAHDQSFFKPGLR